ATASEIPKIALAPSFPLSAVPSISIMSRSIIAWSRASLPRKRGARIRFTFSTALATPFPRKRLPPSLSSTASCSPVDAPDGTVARPPIPFLSWTSTSTVGCPLESRTSRARIPCIFIDDLQKRSYSAQKHKMCYISIGLKNAAAFSLAATLDALRSGVFYFVPLRPYGRRRAGCSSSLAPKGRKSPVRRRKLSSTERERGSTPAHLEAAQ